MPLALITGSQGQERNEEIEDHHDIGYDPWMIPKRAQRHKGRNVPSGKLVGYVGNTGEVNQSQDSGQPEGSRFNALLGDPETQGSKEKAITIVGP